MGLGTVLSGLVYLGTQVSGQQGSYNSRTYGDAENASLLDVSDPSHVALAYPHFVAITPYDEQSLMKSLGMMGTGGESGEFYFYHYCHYLPVAGSPDFAYNFPSEGDVCDAYKAALLANPFLTGAANPSIHNGYDVTFRFTKTQLLKIEHHTIIFKHKVELFT